MLKLTQPGVAHTKIVQRNANAGIAQRLQNGNGFVRIVNASALHDIGKISILRRF